LLNHDLSLPANEYEQFVYAAHAIEITWMVMYEHGAEVIRNYSRRLRTFSDELRGCEGPRHGGLLRSLSNVDQNTWRSTRLSFHIKKRSMEQCASLSKEGIPGQSSCF
jgi:hypothetical protein